MKPDLLKLSLCCTLFILLQACNGKTDVENDTETLGLKTFVATANQQCIVFWQPIAWDYNNPLIEHNYDIYWSTAANLSTQNGTKVSEHRIYPYNNYYVHN